MISCGVPLQFPISGVTSTMTLSATATLRGYDVFVADDNTGALRGFTYNFVNNELAAGAADVAIAQNANGPLAVLASGNDVLVAMPYGIGEAVGTTLMLLDAQLRTHSDPAPAMRDGIYAASGMIARGATDQLAFLTQEMKIDQGLMSGPVDVTRVSPVGAKLDGPFPIIDDAVRAYEPTVVPAANGFLVAWIALSASPHRVQAVLLSDQLAITTPPIDISTPGPTGPVTLNDTLSLRAAYLPGADRLLFTWYQKISGGDQVVISLRDGRSDLAAAHELISLSTQGINPAVVAGSDDFLVVWKAGDLKTLRAARVSIDGEVTPVGVNGTGGLPVAWDLVVRNDQPALVWIEGPEAPESSDSGTLRIDPLCH
jgi:hypothetical protein